MPRISGSSEEISRIVRPCAARCEIVRCTSALVPTSTPCVGSSRIRIRGSAASHFARTTFCWFPPERLRTTCAGEVALIRSCSMNRRASAVHAAAAGPGRASARAAPPSSVVRATDIGWTRPCWSRSSGQVGEAAAERRARRARDEPPPVDRELARRRGDRSRRCARDLRPARADEARQADDLAASKLERDVGEDAAAGSPSARSTTSPISASSFGKSASSDRPTISRTISAWGSSAGRPRRDVPPVAKHRDGVRDRRDLLEPVADEDDRNAALAQTAHGREEAVDLVRRERRGRLVHDQEAGARRERLRDLEELTVGDAEARERAHRAGMSAPRSSRMPRASERIARQSTARDSVWMWRPAKTFSATVRSWKDRRLLVHRHDAEPVRGLRVADSHQLARRSRSSPSSGCTMPVRIFTSVDLPAPFSPTSACTVPA